MSSFDLTRQPWITSMNLGGEVSTGALLETFARAHELRGLANESPLVDAAVFRLLLAILQRCFEPLDNKRWRELYALGRLEMGPVEAYLDKWRERFDLFHPERPFYQVARLIEQSANYERGTKPAREMIAEQSAYGGPRAVFESRPSDDFSIPAATAARWLSAIQAFHPGGLLTRDAANGDPTSVKAAPLCAAALVTVRGANLFDSLMLNLLPYPNNGVFPSTKDDAPAWETAPVVRYRKRACHGWLDWLTWQSRRLQLFGNADDGVSGFLLLGGTDLVAEEPTPDPMCAYKIVEKIGRVAIAFSEDRALWRDSAALLQIQQQSTDKLISARVVSELVQKKVPRTQRLQLQIYGQVPNKASLMLTRTEIVPLPSELLEHGELVGYIRRELELAESTLVALRSALRRAVHAVLALGDRKPDAKDVAAVTENLQAVPRFWAAMKPHFDRFIETLAVNADEATKTFRQALAAEAAGAFDRALTFAGTPARVLKGSTLGRLTLRRELGRLGLFEPAREDSTATSTITGDATP